MTKKAPSLGAWLEEKPFTLALSSSFFGFYAHCGLAAALFEAGLKPAKLTGASAGALVAGALASGIEPAELKEILFALKREDFWDPAPGFGYLRGKKFRSRLEELFAPSFASAQLPLEVAVFDLLAWKTTFLKEGSVATAVVASCAVPLLFHPVRIGRRVYLDGGLFHKSGVAKAPGERILCAYIERSDSVSSAYEWGSSLKSLGEGQKILRLDGLPAVGYNALGAGQAAYEQAYQRMRRALIAPAEKVMRG